MKNNLIKNIMIHIKYPYTAAIIATMWIGFMCIIEKQSGNLEPLIILISIATIIIAYFGFRTTK